MNLDRVFKTLAVERSFEQNQVSCAAEQNEQVANSQVHLRRQLHHSGVPRRASFVDGVWHLGGFRAPDSSRCSRRAAPDGVVEGRPSRDTHFFRMPMKMRSLELSLWFSSA